MMLGFLSCIHKIGQDRKSARADILREGGNGFFAKLRAFDHGNVGKAESEILMAVRVQFENSSEVGVFAVLTNTYCLVAQGGSENFSSVFESELSQHIPVIRTTIGGTRIIGRLCVGNRHGLLVPSITTDTEMQHLRNCLPESVTVSLSYYVSKSSGSTS